MRAGLIALFVGSLGCSSSTAGDQPVPACVRSASYDVETTVTGGHATIGDVSHQRVDVRVDDTGATLIFHLVAPTEPCRATVSGCAVTAGCALNVVLVGSNEVIAETRNVSWTFSDSGFRGTTNQFQDDPKVLVWATSDIGVLVP